MIPQAIELKGFLSYKESQRVPFGDAPLWMLAGANGSGKSSVFDAMTFALFGAHRGGSQNATELINKECNGFEVSFDFLLDGELYRIKRTLKRTKSGGTSATQQVFFRAAGAGGAEGSWAAVDDTGLKKGFDKWVGDHVGLDYATFTSSVLLLQGRAEKLLDSAPSGRAEVLAKIVDLARFQRLHEKANGVKLSLKARVEAMQHQVEGVPDVPDEQYAEALAAIAAAEFARDEAEAGVRDLAGREEQSRRWLEAQTRLTAASERSGAAERTMADAVQIEKRHARLTELRAVLPHVGDVVQARNREAESRKKSEDLQRRREDARNRVAAAEHAGAQARKKREQHRQALVADEEKARAAGVRLRELATILEKVRQAEGQQADADRLQDELSRLPRDAESLALAAVSEVERLAALASILPNLELVSTERHDLAQAKAAERDAKAEQAKIQAEAEGVKGKIATAKESLDAARRGRQAAEERATAGRVRLESARQALAELAHVDGKTTCLACGQPLTPAHLAAERKRRGEEEKRAAAEAAMAQQARADSLAAEAVAAEEVAALDAKVSTLRESYRDAMSAAKQAAGEAARLVSALALRYAGFPREVQQKIAPAEPSDWSRTRFPERDELVALRRDVAGLDAARRRQREALAAADRAGKLRAKLDSALAALARLRGDLPGGDPAALREEQRRLTAEEKTAQDAIREGRKSVAALDAEIERHAAEGHDALQAVTELQGRLAAEELTRSMSREQAERSKAKLPPAWAMLLDGASMSEYARFRTEEQELIDAGVEARFSELARARHELAKLRQDVLSCQADVDAFPPEARRAPDAVAAELRAARDEFARIDKDVQAAARRRDVLDGYRARRAELSDQARELDRQFHRYKTLAELLGRDRLQRHLVRRAERQIVDHANGVLDRLSGGQLSLRLVPGEDGTGAEKALEMECVNRASGSSPINVTFLSGSQRFRVAVALALAIGQFASRGHRPIESVIIDEGFGCLDRQGRQGMIQELQNLRGHLRCILLVSHQEEFAEAFADGYRFRLEDGATRVERFER